MTPLKTEQAGVHASDLVEEGKAQGPVEILKCEALAPSMVPEFGPLLSASLYVS